MSLLVFKSPLQPDHWIKVATVILIVYLAMRTAGLMQREALAIYSACVVVYGKVLPPVQTLGRPLGARFE